MPRSTTSSPRAPLDQPFEAPDYHDHFTLRTAEHRFETIEAFTKALVLRQPGWLTKVSMGIGGKTRLCDAVGAGVFPVGSAIGNWQVVDRGDRHVTFGEDMRIMAYRLTYTWLAPDHITASTEVRQTSRLAGPMYWAIVTPLHCRFLARMLRNAGGARSTVSESTVSDSTSSNGLPYESLPM